MAPPPLISRERLGPVTDAVDLAAAELEQREALARLESGDHTLWQDDPTEVADRLGWLPVVDEMRAVVDLGDILRRPGLDIGIGADGGDDAVLDQQAAIGLVEVAFGIGEAQRSAPEREQAPPQECLRHSCLPSTALSNQATSRSRSSGVMSVTLPGGMAWLRPACI